MTRYLDILNIKNDEVQILAAVHYARSLECLKSGHDSLKKGRLLAAFTVIRSAIEADFCLSALVEDSQQAMNAMLHRYLKETKREYRTQLDQGHVTTNSGSDIQELLDYVNEQLILFRGSPSTIKEIADIGNRLEDYSMSYQICCQRSHPYSLITAVNEQFGPGEGVVVRTGYKDVISSDDFLIVAAYGLNSIENAANLIGAELNDEHRAIGEEIDAASPNIAPIKRQNLM